MEEVKALPIWRDQRPQIKRKYTQEVADWAYNLKFSDLPAEVVDKAKYMALDFIGQAIGGISGKGRGGHAI